MEHSAKEKPALLIIDMVKDNMNPDHPLPITPFALKAIPPTNELIKVLIVDKPLNSCYYARYQVPRD